MIKYIFSINPGRVGSNYLSKVFSHVNGIVSFHEPSPIMNGKVMREFLKGNRKLMEEKMPEKIRQINSSVDDAEVYIETNHCFIKGFGWYLANALPNEEIGVILIKRDNEQVTNSLFKIGCSPLVKMGRKWIMTPAMKDPLNKIASSDIKKYLLYSIIAKLFRNRLNKRLFKIKIPGFIVQYEKRMIAWYVKETYSQAEKFKLEFPAIKIFETQTDQLNSTDEIKRMFDFFQIPFDPKPAFNDVVGVITNKKLKQKSTQI